MDGVEAGALPAPQWRRRVGLLPAESAWWSDTVGPHFNQVAPRYTVPLLGNTMTGMPDNVPDCRRHRFRHHHRRVAGGAGGCLMNATACAWTVCGPPGDAAGRGGGRLRRGGVFLLQKKSKSIAPQGSQKSSKIFDILEILITKVLDSPNPQP